jgi:F0F1-type ATP synthase epsilon subunit
MASRTDASTGETIADKPVDLTKDEKGKPLMQVKVYSPFKVYFEQPAYSVSAENNAGPFDILPRHHNFVTMVNPCVMKISTPTGESKIKIGSSMMHVKSDKVTVFLDV